MSKKLIIIFLSFIFLFTPFLVSAQKPEDWEPPAKDGVYNVPGKQGLKVRVFVHKDKETNSAKGQPWNPLSCNLGDPDMTLTIPRELWRLPSTWTYRLNTSSAPSSVGGSNFKTFVRRGFDSWQSAAGGKVTLTQGADTTINKTANDGQNVITWGTAPSGALAVSYVWYYTSSGQLIDSDIIMNKNYSWTWSNSLTCAYKNTYDAENIMTHEQGHWFGLDDVYDSAYRYGTMFGYGYKGEVLKSTLSTGDKAGVYAIYNP